MIFMCEILFINLQTIALILHNKNGTDSNRWRRWRWRRRRQPCPIKLTIFFSPVSHTTHNTFIHAFTLVCVLIDLYFACVVYVFKWINKTHLQYKPNIAAAAAMYLCVVRRHITICMPCTHIIIRASIEISQQNKPIQYIDQIISSIVVHQSFICYEWDCQWAESTSSKFVMMVMVVIDLVCTRWIIGNSRAMTFCRNSFSQMRSDDSQMMNLHSKRATTTTAKKLILVSLLCCCM